MKLHLNETANRKVLKIPPTPFRKGGVKDGFAALSLFYKKIEYLPSTFDIHY